MPDLVTFPAPAGIAGEAGLLAAVAHPNPAAAKEATLLRLTAEVETKRGPETSKAKLAAGAGNRADPPGQGNG